MVIDLSKITLLSVISALNSRSAFGGSRWRSLSCPSICSDNVEPVCGSDGVLYTNDCDRRKRTCGTGNIRFYFLSDLDAFQILLRFQNKHRLQNKHRPSNEYTHRKVCLFCFCKVLSNMPNFPVFLLNFPLLFFSGGSPVSIKMIVYRNILLTI